MSDPPALTSPLLAAVSGLRHAFFTRRGGVSTGLYGSLNVGQGSKDDPDAVQENRRRAASHFAAGPEALLTCYQVHSATAVQARGPWAGERPRADAVVTAEPGLICGALSADCAPVLLVDPEARVAAAVHAGWRGALGGVVEATLAAMDELGARRRQVLAAVGPCIGPRSYEVGLEFLAAFKAGDLGAEAFFRPGASADKRLFDLPAFVLDRLAKAGVGDADWIGRDTCAEPDWFFSNRRAVLNREADYGRLMSAIALTPESTT